MTHGRHERHPNIKAGDRDPRYNPVSWVFVGIFCGALLACAAIILIAII